MLVRLTEWPSTSLDQLRRNFVQALTLDKSDFYKSGPLVIVEDEDRPYMPIKDGNSLWLNVNFWRAYFSEDYRRGNKWIEQVMPGSQVFYGHDIDDENIALFDKPTRQRLLSVLNPTPPHPTPPSPNLPFRGDPAKQGREVPKRPSRQETPARLMNI